MSDEMLQGQMEQFDGQTVNEENANDNAENQMAVDGDDGEDDRKVFVGGLSWETTTKDLREYFEKYGEVTNCTLKTDLETRKSRGFGFVVFSSREAIDKVLAEKEHKLHGRTIDPKQANPRPVNKKVFVGRLDPTITEDQVKAYFETFGPVDKLELPFDKTKEQRRAFCFVEFKKLASMKKCLEQTNHKIGAQEYETATEADFVPLPAGDRIDGTKELGVMWAVRSHGFYFFTPTIDGLEAKWPEYPVEVKKATPPGGGNIKVGGPRGRGFVPGGRGARGGRGGFQGGYGYNQGYGGYGSYSGYGAYDQSYGYGGYGGDYYGGGYGGYSGWNGGGYDQGYGYGGYGGYEDWGYGQGGEY